MRQVWGDVVPTHDDGGVGSQHTTDSCSLTHRMRDARTWGVWMVRERPMLVRGGVGSGGHVGGRMAISLGMFVVPSNPPSNP